MADNLTKMFKAGPEVSFKGSPTVSPITAALWTSSPFLYYLSSTINFPASMYFLALSQAPPALADEIAIETPEINIPGNNPATAVGPKNKPTTNGDPKTMVAGKNISYKEAVVAT